MINIPPAGAAPVSNNNTGLIDGVVASGLFLSIILTFVSVTVLFAATCNP